MCKLISQLFLGIFSYREAPRAGVGLGRGDRLDLAALMFCPATVADWAFSGYFFVLGQTRRHGCDFNVAVASFTLSALC
jgi:hypothetical protein